MIEFRVLGSLEVVEQARPLELGGPRQRALLAVLLVHRGEPVSSERLVDELWGQQSPASAIKIVQGYVSNLRKVLGDGLLVTRGHGYLLQAQSGQVDLDRFESLVAEGRQALQRGDAHNAAARLREALALWRGPPFADFAYESFAQPVIARLEDSRLAALEDQIDAQLALGDHAQVVGELGALVREHPLRERFVGQLMIALYRSGRQADALESYRDARRRLVEELGLEPSHDLLELEHAILAQAPELEPPARDTARVLPAAAAPGRRRGLLIAAGGLALLAALTAVSVRLAASGTRAVRVPPNSLAAIDIRSDRVTEVVPVGARPSGVVFASGSLWVANLDDQTISRVDPTTLRTLQTITVRGPPTGIAASSRGPWVVESPPNHGASPGTSSVFVGRVDPQFNLLGNRVRIGNVVPSGPGAIVAQGNSVWVAPSTGLLTRINANTEKVAQQFDPNASPAGIAVGEGAVWISDTNADDVVRVDPTGFLKPIPVGNGPTGVAAGAGGVWIADSLDDAVVRIDPGTGSVVARIPVGRSPGAVSVGAGSVWVANGSDGTVTRIDPNTDKPVATIAVGGSPQGITIAGGRVWVTVDAQAIAPSDVASDGSIFRMASSADVDFMDPALAYTGLSWQLLYATCAQLVSYPDKPGPAGSQLTAEVAQSLPTRSADGRTYTFTIRPGFRFSPSFGQPSGEPVTAETFKKTIERTLNPRMRSPSARYLADVAGAAAYRAGRARQIAGVIANGDKLTIRLLAPAPDFLSRIAQPAFCAVPSSTPPDPNGLRVIPSAGPYHVTTYTPGQGVVLMRNPNYHGSRPHHFARIELAVGISDQRAAAEVASGGADYMVLGLNSNPSTATAALASRLATRYGLGSAAAARGAQRYFVSPILELDAFALNTHRPLFSDVRLRQAVNYAIDRRALAALGSGFQPLPEQPTDHYLPPKMPGFRDAHIYPMIPNRAKARQLVQLAHARGRTAVLYTINTPPSPQQAQIVKTDLAAVGINVQVKTFPNASLFTRLATPGEPFDLGYMGWQADFSDPSQILNPLLVDDFNLPPLEDPAYQRLLARTARRSGPERYLAYGQLDLALARNAAPLAAFGNTSSHDFFSSRIGCQTYGIYGMDLAALCLRHPGA